MTDEAKEAIERIAAGAEKVAVLAELALEEALRLLREGRFNTAFGALEQASAALQPLMGAENRLAGYGVDYIFMAARDVYEGVELAGYGVVSDRVENGGMIELMTPRGAVAYPEMRSLVVKPVAPSE